MTKYLIIGGGGMIGRKIATLIHDRASAENETADVVQFDIGIDGMDPSSAQKVRGSLLNDGDIKTLAAGKPDVIIQLAAMLSGESERNFEGSWRLNLFANWQLLSELRAQHAGSSGNYRPRVVFASSVAVYGPPFEGPVDDLHICEPRTSYGAQKAASELMISDFSRKGWIDGISLRLPTITVRPGKPNAAASSCFSAIIREPLNGRRTALPIRSDVRHMHASPRSAARFFLHAAELDTGKLEGRRALNMPSVTCSVEEQIEALRAVAGSKAVGLIDVKPDPFIQSIVGSWAEEFRAERAEKLGFAAEKSFEEIVRTYIEEDLPFESDQDSSLPKA